MIRRLSASLAMLLALGACSSGTSIGSDLDYTPPPSSKPPATSKKPQPAKTTKKAPPPTTQKPQGPKAETHEVKATSGFVFEPNDFAVRTGDKVKFMNTHNGQDHSFTVEGTPIDSGPVKGGESYTATVNLAPGTYQFKCTVVPYMVAGKMVVFG
jgi:plastocyanin